MPPLDRPPPPYMQIAEHYASAIREGRMKPGDRFPSERELCDEWQVSKPTAGKAVARLRDQGLIVTTVGIGAQVAPAAMHEG